MYVKPPVRAGGFDPTDCRREKNTSEQVCHARLQHAQMLLRQPHATRLESFEVLWKRPIFSKTKCLLLEAFRNEPIHAVENAYDLYILPRLPEIAG